MSLGAILSTATSGLQVAQSGLRLVSDNVSNVDTPGYVRKVQDQVSSVVGGAGQGVDVARVRLAADRFLQTAGLNAAAGAAGAGVLSEMLDRAQTLFGDPASNASMFGKLDSLFAALEAASSDPTSTVLRREALRVVDDFFRSAASISDQLDALPAEADSKLATGVDEANRLLAEIDAMNAGISRAVVSGGDATGLQNAQATLIDQLSSLMELRVTEKPAGGVSLRTPDGVILAGDGAAKFSLADGQVVVTPPGGQPANLASHMGGGELKALLDARNREIPALASAFDTLTRHVADELNRVHNAASAVPAPARLSGRDTGLDLPTAIGGFTGRSVIAFTDAAGRVTRRVAVDFSAGTISADGAAPAAFTPASFLNTLNAALSPAGAASFTNRALTLDAALGGVSVADDPSAPSAKAGRSFGHAFGLNDLVRGDASPTAATGLRGSDPHGFTAGQAVTLRLTDANGGRLRDVSVAVPAGGAMSDLLGALNATGSGVGLYGRFSLDGEGRMSFAPTTTPPASLTVVTDATSRGAGGPSLSRLFGLGDQGAVFGVRSDIAADPNRLALASLETTAGVGAIALSPADGRGGRALATLATKLSAEASTFGGQVGARAASAASAKTSADAVALEATTRRAGVEGVNLDEELILMTTYQQAYSANARMIQAVKDLYDVLLAL